MHAIARCTYAAARTGILKGDLLCHLSERWRVAETHLRNTSRRSEDTRLPGLDCCAHGVLAEVTWSGSTSASGSCWPHLTSISLLEARLNTQEGTHAATVRVRASAISESVLHPSAAVSAASLRGCQCCIPPRLSVLHPSAAVSATFHRLDCDHSSMLSTAKDNSKGVEKRNSPNSPQSQRDSCSPSDGPRSTTRPACLGYR
jgi:hypothetical protein